MKIRLLLSLVIASFVPAIAKKECKPVNSQQITRKAPRGSGQKKQKKEKLTPGIHELNDERRLQRIVQGNDDLIVLFHSPACGACERMMRILRQYVQQHPELVVVRAQRGRSKRVAKKYAVRGVPTLLRFKKGEEITRIVGFRTLKKLTKELASV